jgi:hypothetical protein
MFIWGRGGVIPLIAFGCALVTEFSTRTALGDINYYQTLPEFFTGSACNFNDALSSFFLATGRLRRKVNPFPYLEAGY